MEGKVQHTFTCKYENIKNKRMEKIYYADAKTSQKNADVTILTQNKLDLRAKTIIRNKVVHFILIKGIVNDII